MTINQNGHLPQLNGSAPPQAVARSARPIFRLNAIKHYVDKQDESVLPRYVTPRSFLILWMLLLLLVCAFSLSYFAQIPINESGVGVVVRDAEQALVLAVVLPTNSVAQAGNQSQIRLGGDNNVQTQLAQADRAALSLAELKNRYGISAELLPHPNQPVTVALAPLPTTLSHHSAELYEGAHLPVDVTVGSRRLITLLPLPGLTGE